jgi:hypothetical protein
MKTKRDKNFRRDQDLLALNKARIIARSYTYDRDEKTIEKIAHRIKKNRQACSCHMCGNPRRSVYAKGKSKLTIQERKHI